MSADSEPGTTCKAPMRLRGPMASRSRSSTSSRTRSCGNRPVANSPRPSRRHSAATARIRRGRSQVRPTRPPLSRMAHRRDRSCKPGASDRVAPHLHYPLRDKGGEDRMAARNSKPRNSKPPRTSSRKQRNGRVGYAVVGQGYISQVAVLPAFANARRNSELVALVSDDPAKLDTLGRRYGARHLYTYADFDACLANDDVDAIFIALPNHLHHPYTLRAARAGKHVLCEKPMAVTEDECREMAEEAEQNRVQLMVAYRLHFERAN